MTPIPQLRKTLEALGLDLSLPPWPEYLRAHAEARRKSQEDIKANGPPPKPADCPNCRINTDG
jgi:hypothetical protein